MTPTGTKRRTVYDAASAITLPGKLLCSEIDPPSKEIAVNEAFDGAGAVNDFYRAKFKRNSIDDKGMRLNSTVYCDHKYGNAFWSGQWRFRFMRTQHSGACEPSIPGHVSPVLDA